MVIIVWLQFLLCFLKQLTTSNNWFSRSFFIDRRFSPRALPTVEKPRSIWEKSPRKSRRISYSIPTLGYNSFWWVKKWHRINCWCSLKCRYFALTVRLTWNETIFIKEVCEIIFVVLNYLWIFSFTIWCLIRS